MAVVKKAITHLKGDIKDYEKEIRHLEKEIEEDKQLLRELKREKRGVEKVRSTDSKKCSCSMGRRRKTR